MGRPQRPGHEARSNTTKPSEKSMAKPNAQYDDASKLSDAARGTPAQQSKKRCMEDAIRMWSAQSTATYASGLPCTSEPTVNVCAEESLVTVEGRQGTKHERPLPGSLRTEQPSTSGGLQEHDETSVQQSICMAQLSARSAIREEQEYESKLLVSPEASRGDGAFKERARPSTAAETWRSASGIHCSPIFQCWPAHRDPAAKAALSMEGSDDIESHWDDYQPPNHPVLHDLDTEE